MSSSNTKSVLRTRRHDRVRHKVVGTSSRPRLAVFRSNKHISAQLIDDSVGRTIAAASTLEPTLRSNSGANKQAATLVGQLLAERAQAAGITKVVFDRGGFLYHGRVAAVAEAARKQGLEF